LRDSFWQVGLLSQASGGVPLIHGLDALVVAEFVHFVSVCSRDVPPRSPTRCSGRSRFRPLQLKETSRERTLTQVVEAIWAD
jgi:hypothetical protein